MFQLRTDVIIQILNHKYAVWYYRSGPDDGSVTSQVTRSSLPIKTQTRFLWEGLNQPETPSVWSQLDWSLLLRLQCTCRVRCIAQNRRRNNTTDRLTSFFRAAGDEQCSHYSLLSVFVCQWRMCWNVWSLTLSHSESLTSFSSITLWLMYICVFASKSLQTCLCSLCLLKVLLGFVEDSWWERPARLLRPLVMPPLLL